MKTGAISFFFLLSVLFLLNSCGSSTKTKTPETPAGITGSSGYEKAYLEWKPVYNATSYNIYQSTDINGEYRKVESHSNNDFTVTNLVNKTHYFFKVSATNAIGESALSASVDVVPNISLVSPYIERQHVYKGQLHAHSTNSDGNLLPSDLLAAYHNLGYDFMVISDHDFLTSDAQYPGILHLTGVEESSYEGHIVTVNARRDQISWVAQTIVNNTVSDGGISILAHPNYSDTVYTVDELMLLNGYTAIEVFNALVEEVEGDGNAEAKWDALLTSGRRIFGVAVDDMHSLTQSNKAWVKVFADNPVTPEVVDALRSGNFYASTGPDLSVHMLGNSVMIQTDSPSSIDFISTNGRIIKQDNDVTTSSYNFVGNEGYVRMRITRNSDGKKAWSNPIIAF